MIRRKVVAARNRRLAHRAGGVGHDEVEERGGEDAPTSPSSSTPAAAIDGEVRGTAKVDHAAIARAVRAGTMSREQARMLTVGTGSMGDDAPRRMPTCPTLLEMVRRARENEARLGRKAPTARELNQTAVTFSKEQREQIWNEDPKARIHDFVWHERLPRLLAEDVEKLVMRTREFVFKAEQALGEACSDEEVRAWIVANDPTLREWQDDDCLEYSMVFSRMAVRNLDGKEWVRMIGQLRILADLQRGKLTTSDATVAISEFFRTHISKKRGEEGGEGEEEGVVTGFAHAGMS